LPSELRLYADEHVRYIQTLDDVRRRKIKALLQLTLTQI